MMRALPILALLAFFAAGCSLEPVPLEGRICRTSVDCLVGQRYFCQPIDTGDGTDGGVPGTCLPLSTLDSGVDADVRDGGSDAGRDAAVDAGDVDAGDVDAAVDDAGMDAGDDAAVDDAGMDAGDDAAIDAAVDAGSDAGDDAAVDAGTDAGSDAG